MAAEVYAAVPDAPHLLVSSAGRVLSARKGWREVGFYDKRGYRLVHIQGRHVFIHRLVALAFIGRQPEGKPLVRHLNGKPDDNRAENLAWGDGVENMADARRHGTLREGPGHHNWKDACVNGHELSGDNLMLVSGRRRCRTCAKKWYRDYHARRKQNA